MALLNKQSFSVYFLAMLVAAMGCAPATETPPKTSTPPAAAPSVSLQTLDYEGVQELIASHRGKVVVMDCWSTSCEPCMREFPKLVALNRKYGSEKVACISLSFDYEGIDKIEEVQPHVLEFLKKQQATFDNVLGSEESDVMYKKMELASIPAVYVYDRDGKLAKRFEGSKAYDEVPILVEKLLGN